MLRASIDTGTPVTDPIAVERDPEVAPTIRHALCHARLTAEHAAIERTMPTGVSDELRDARVAAASIRRSLADLEDGSGDWRGTKVGEVARIIRETEQRRASCAWRVNVTHGSEQRSVKRTLRQLEGKLEQVSDRFETLAQPHRRILNASLATYERRKTDLESNAAARTEWLAAHSDTARRLEHLDNRLAGEDRWLTSERNQLDGILPSVGRDHVLARTRELLDNLPAPQLEPNPWWQQMPVRDGIELGR